MAVSSQTQSSITDPEVAMEVVMHELEPAPAPSEVLQQILGELRDFRKEFNGKAVSEETAGLQEPRVPAVQTDSEHVKANLYHPLPSLPAQGASLPHHPVLKPNISMPGQYPNSIPMAETVPVAESDSYQHRLDMEKAQITSYYNGEMKKLEDEIDAKKELWEVVRKKNVELNKELAEQQTKVTKLQKMMARAGRNDNAAIDGDINTQFVLLKIDILQVVKNHLVYHPDRSPNPGASSDLPELYLRMKVALALYDKLFSRKALLFGYDDGLFDKSPLRKFEEALLENNCDEWRVATVKACKLLDRNLDGFATAISDQIWSESLHTFRKSFVKSGTARRDLDNLCRKAVKLAILFRSSPIEYEWEQDTSRLDSLEVNSKDHEIIGTKGPNPNEESNFEISYIVFGGVVRGDKSTGLLENGRLRLGKTHVVIKQPKP